MESRLITITEMAQWQDVTTETLRYYDKIGLFKPVYQDDHGMRYYSVQQYERLGTIRDLAQNGIGLSDIKDYLEKRNLKSSKELLKLQDTKIQDKIESLWAMHRSLLEEYSWLDQVTDQSYDTAIKHKNLPRLSCFVLDAYSTDDDSLAQSWHEIEKEFRYQNKTERSPVFATNKFAAIFYLHEMNRFRVAYLSREKSEVSHTAENLQVYTLPAGSYICKRHRGTFFDAAASADELTNYAAENHLKVRMPWLIDRIIVDYTVTDEKEEMLNELCLPIDEQASSSTN
ncbi:MAG: MerR family transcriptional regulator [Eggerthellaceae bacterium]|jgi:DNA-binding transcriptional MerR regulator